MTPTVRWTLCMTLWCLPIPGCGGGDDDDNSAGNGSSAGRGGSQAGGPPESGSGGNGGKSGSGANAGKGGAGAGDGGATAGIGAGGAGEGGSDPGDGGGGQAGSDDVDGGSGNSGSTQCKAPEPAASSGNECPIEAPVPLQLTLIKDNLNNPVFVTQAPGDDTRLFVVQRGGRIRMFDPENGDDLGDFLTVPEVAASEESEYGGEMGLLGLAFHPDYPDDPRLFVNYTAQDLTGEIRTVIASFEVMANDPDQADPDSMQSVLELGQPQPNHNGGMLAFGPDGCLFVASGDGGNGNDVGPGHAPEGNGQNLDTPLGKLLRLDVDDPSSSAPGNLSGAGNPHIWDYGLRNPWRFSFDRERGDLYIGDVGQLAYEEVNVEPKGVGHHNYGWKIAEAAHCLPAGPGSCDMDGLVAPVDEYAHGGGDNCIIGGYVYRGSAIPSLQGFYLHADNGSRKIRAFTWDGNGRCGDETIVISDRDDINLPVGITSFGEDVHGELYVTTSRALYRIEARP